MKLTSATCAVKLTSFVKIGGELSNGHLKIPSETRKTALKISPLISEFLYTSHFFNTGDLSIRPLTLHITTHLWPSLWQSKDVSLSHNVLQLPHHSISSHSRAYETISPGEIELCLPKARYNELFNVASPLKPKFTKLVLFSVSKVSVTPFGKKNIF